MLGHEQLSSTQLHTQVAIRKLKEIHTATHPAARLARKADQGQEHPGRAEGRAEILAQLDVEDDEHGDER